MISDEEIWDLDEWSTKSAAASTHIAPRSTPFVSSNWKKSTSTPHKVYRSPTIVKASNGHLLAFAEGRDRDGDDCQADIVLRRSTDNGATWKDLQVVAGDGVNRFSYPTPVALDNGRIVLLYNWNRFVEREADRGCFKFFMKTSSDNGKTWSRKVNVTSQTTLPCKEKNGVAVDPPASGNWGYTWLGGAHGIVKTASPKAGRILVCARHGCTDGKARSHVIYSDDKGSTWKIGGTLGAKSTECTVAELPDGKIMVNARSNNTTVNRRTVAVSKDAGKSFGTPWIEDEFPEPGGCAASLLRYGSNLLFSNPNSTERRTKGTLRRSPNGYDWTNERQYIRDGEFSGYSDLVRVGDVGVLVEWGPDVTLPNPRKEIRFIVVPKADLGL